MIHSDPHRLIVNIVVVILQQASIGPYRPNKLLAIYFINSEYGVKRVNAINLVKENFDISLQEETIYVKQNQPTRPTWCLLRRID